MEKYIFIAFLSLLLFSCTKESNAVWYRYAETQCADKWEGLNANSVNPAEAAALYLEDKGVKIYDSKYVSTFYPFQTCLACDCLTGAAIRIKARKKVKEELEVEGFELE